MKVAMHRHISSFVNVSDILYTMSDIPIHNNELHVGRIIFLNGDVLGLYNL